MKDEEKGNKRLIDELKKCASVLLNWKKQELNACPENRQASRVK